MTDFIKVNSYQEEHGIYVRASAVNIIHADNEGITKLFIDGIAQPMHVMQSPDEILALMKDDAASLPVRHIADIVDRQLDAAETPSAHTSATFKSPKEHLSDVKSRYQKAG